MLRSAASGDQFRSVALGRVFVILGGLIVLALTAALVGPYFVDWSSYRASFEREASRVLGRKVTVEGSVAVRLLPFPSVSFSDIRVGAADRVPAITVKTFSMDAEIAPLLSSQVLIYDMRIEDPHMVLTVDPDGTVDWAIRPSAPFDARQITLEKVTLEGGQVDIVDKAAGKRHSVTGIDATLSASTLAGPWHMEGEATVDGERARITASTNEVKPDEPLRMHTRIAPQGVAAVFETDGELTAPGGKVRYAGSFDIRSSDLVPAVGAPAKDSSQAATSGREQPLLSKVRVSGQFKAEHASVTVSTFRMEQGPSNDPYVINGSGTLDIGSNPRFSLSANGQQILIGPERTQGEEPDKPNSATGAGSLLASRLSFFKSVLASIPTPSIPGTVHLKLPAIIVGGTTIRDIAVDAAPASGTWSIAQFSAGLPGRTQIEASGTLAVSPSLGFSGRMLVASRQPSGLSSWLTGNVDESVRRLSGAGFSANVDIDAERQSFDGLEIALGQTDIRGSVVREPAGEGRPSITARLTAGSLDADSFAVLKSFMVSDAGRPQIGGSDLNVTMKAGPVSLQGLDAKSFETSFRARGGKISLDRLVLQDLAGTSLTAKGEGSPFAAQPTGSFQAEVRSRDLDKLLEAVASNFPGVAVVPKLRDQAALYPGLFRDTQLSIGGAVNGNANGLSVSLKGEGKTGGTAISFTAGGTGPDLSLSALDLDLHANASSPEGEALLALAGLPAVPLQLIGSLEGDLTIKGKLAKGAAAHVVLTGSGASAAVDGTLALAEGGLRSSGVASLTCDDLDPYLAVLGYAVPGFGNGLPAELTGNFSLMGGKLDITRLSGSLADDPIAADLTVTRKDGMPRIAGRATLARLDLSSMAAFLLGPEAFVAAPGHDWPQRTFAQAPSFPLGADVTMSADVAQLGPGSAIAHFRGNISLNGDDLRVSGVSGQFAGGKLGGLAELRNSEGTALLNTQFTLDGADFGELYGTSGGPRPISGNAAISASINGTGKTVAALVSSLAGSGTISTKGLVIDGLDPDALGPAMQEADAEGPTANPAELEKIAGRHIAAGRFDAGSADLPFTMTAGVMRLSGLQLTAKGTTLSADIQADIGADRLDGSGSFTFDPGKDGMGGATASIGFALAGTIESPVAKLDVQPLVQFLTQRSLEREQQRVEAMQAGLLEKQRLRREAGFYQMRARQRFQFLQKAAQQRAAEAAATDAKAVEAARQKAADAARSKAAHSNVLESQLNDAGAKTLEDQQQKAILDFQRRQSQAPDRSGSGTAGGTRAAPGTATPVAPSRSDGLPMPDQSTVEGLIKSWKFDQ